MKTLGSEDAFFLYFETPDQHQHTVGTLVLDPSTAPEHCDIDTLADRLEFLLDGHIIPHERLLAARAVLRRRPRIRFRDGQPLPPGARELHREPDGTFVNEFIFAPATRSQGSTWDLDFSPDEDQTWIYMADGQNMKVYVIERSTMEVLYSFGDGGRQPGQFFAVHSIATDSKGNIYTTETYEGKRVQKFTYTGMGPVSGADQGVVDKAYGEGVLTREIKDGVVRIVHCIGIQEGDRLLIAPGDLVPVELRVLNESVRCSLDWIDGESRPRRFAAGDAVPAGAFNVGERAFSGVALTSFASSSLPTFMMPTTGPKLSSVKPAKTFPTSGNSSFCRASFSEATASAQTSAPSWAKRKAVARPMPWPQMPT